MSDTPLDSQPFRRLLERLADGDVHSGQELGELLGVSRTAVWKHLQKLEPLGLTLESVKGRGYRLPGGLELLDADAILGAVDPGVRSLLAELDIQPVVDSTNARALSRAQPGCRGHVCLAEQQTAGRGRRGRTWVSPFGRNIYLSLLWDFESGAAALEGLSLAVGVAMVRALQRFGVAGVRLKWPNDLLWHDRKLAGVLLEMSGDPAGACQVVVGVGVNLAMPPETGAAIDQPWVDLREAAGGEPPGRNRLVAALLSELLPLLRDYQRDGFAHWRPQWEQLDACREREVVLSTASRSVQGRVLGVSDSGALRLLVDGTEQLHHGGEVSLRAVS